MPPEFRARHTSLLPLGIHQVLQDETHISWSGKISTRARRGCREGGGRSFNAQRSESRTLRSASSPSIVSTRPERTSSRLRKASVAQSLSMGPSSSQSRLSTKRSANLARESLDNVIACSASCSQVVAMRKEYCSQRSATSLKVVKLRRPRMLFGLLLTDEASNISLPLISSEEQTPWLTRQEQRL